MNIVRPTLILNKTICIRNIELMIEKAKRHSVRFRPHFKTHQSHQIGQWFRKLGVNSITVSSVQMAQYFAYDNWDDITIAFSINQHEISSINTLAKNITINITIDSVDTLLAIKNKITEQIGVYIKISTGYNRSGINSSSTQKIDKVLQQIQLEPKLNFKGFLSHAGHTYDAKSKYEVQNIHFDALQRLGALKKAYQKKYPNIEISIGDTPSCSLTENFTGIDEIRPGNFVFYDLSQHKIGSCHIDDIALRMHCPVVSKQKTRNEIIIYGGAIHFSKDWIQNIDGKPLYGRIVLNRNNERELLSNKNYLYRLSQEHGVIRTTPDAFKQIEIGDILEIIPAHACLTAHAMGRYITTKGESIEMMPRF